MKKPLLIIPALDELVSKGIFNNISLTLKETTFEFPFLKGLKILLHLNSFSSIIQN